MFELTANVLLVAVSELVGSAATSEQELPDVISAELKLATPPLADRVAVVGLNVHVDDVTLIVSPDPVLDPVSTLPYVSSTDTAKERGVERMPADGWVVKTSLAGAAGFTVNADVVAVPPDVPSVAVKVHDPAVSSAMPGNDAVPPLACSVSVPVGVPQDEEIVMLSVAVPPDSVTVNVPKPVPALLIPVGAFANVRDAVADAGSTPTSDTPASTSTDATPTPIIEPNRDRTCRPTIVPFDLLCIASLFS